MLGADSDARNSKQFKWIDYRRSRDTFAGVSCRRFCRVEMPVGEPKRPQKAPFVRVNTMVSTIFMHVNGQWIVEWVHWESFAEVHFNSWGIFIKRLYRVSNLRLYHLRFFFGR